MDSDSRGPVFAAGTRVERFRFTGTGGEYFRIWIVNLLLTIVTLGIYSAWAKVRKQRYFYGHTHLAGSTFDYHARPEAILKGRLIAAALLAVYVAAGEISPFLLVAVIVAYVVILPWIVVKALQFRARVSSWRGIRFDFDGQLGEAAIVFSLLLLLMPLTLGLILPYWWYRRQRFSIGELRFGATHFRFKAEVGAYYRVFLLLLAVLVGVMVVALGCAFVVALVATLADQTPPEEDSLSYYLVGSASYAAGLVFFSVLNGFARGWIGNLALGNTYVGEHRLRPRFDAAALAWLQFTNTLLVVVTLGLFTPWAQIRLAKYTVEHMSIALKGDLDSFVAAQAQPGSATGGEMADIFDVDIGF
ncbi:MAG: DUF898 domain-containing protein [Planctomycetes bacterium]|nr:DUF898 domain-containing protein [Planctomycetota bacterium]